MYHLHGFRVTSIEFGPIDEVTMALREMAPSIRLLDGDGSKLIPEIVGNMSDREAARTMIFFDGEKRVFAHRTYQKVRARVGAAAFDDSVPGFQKYLSARKETWWQVATEPLFAPIMQLTKRTIEQFKAYNEQTPRPAVPLGVGNMPGTTLYQFGDAWGLPHPRP